MNHDLSKCEVGDWICTAQFGWVQINTINSSFIHPISVVLDGYEETYTLDGYHNKDDKFPSAYVEPPEEWNAFRKDDKVLVGDDKGDLWARRYFSHEKDGKYFCYVDGMDSWTSAWLPSNKLYDSWKYIKPWREEEEKE